MSILLFKNFFGTPSESQKVWIRKFPFSDQKIYMVNQVYPITIELGKRKLIFDHKILFGIPSVPYLIWN